jgi:hypothetical protein
VCKAFPGPLVPPEHLDLRDLSDSLEPQDLRDHKGFKVCPDRQVPQGALELLVLLDPWDLREPLALKV